MKQPVWILNSSLLILFFMSQLLLFMLQKAVPRRISISPGALLVTESQEIEPINLDVICGVRDLFGTYEAPVVIAQRIDDTVAAIPKPPQNIIPERPIEKVPTFFAPLECILKGVIFVKDDPASSLAIIQFKKTKEEQNYQVGDLVEDAQILKILSNRIIIIRSNGQQETLYLREEDAVHDFDTEVDLTPKNVVESSSDHKYKINIDEFVSRVPNLGEFINLLDLTTAYRQGKSFGCRVGKVNKDSLGGMLGFIVDDIIVNIDGFDVDDLSNRIKIYDHMLSRQAGDLIEVQVHRGNNSVTLIYGLIDNQSKNMTFTKREVHEQLTGKVANHEKNRADDNSVIIQRAVRSDLQYDELYEDQNDVSSPMIMPIINQQTLNEVSAHNERLKFERAKLDPTAQQIKAQARDNMLKQNKRNVIFNGMTPP